MYQITDLHSHALSLVDDGARTDEEMYQMIDIAYDDGIRRICFTPHFKQYHFDNGEQISKYNESISRSFSIAEQYVQNKYSDMTLYLGNEIMFHHDIYESISNGSCSLIADTSYALVEFVPDTSLFEISTALANLLRKGIRPILAHIERYECLSKDISSVYELRELGVVIQVNASSVTNLKFGKGAKFIKTLFKKNLVDIIATDAHRADRYKPIMSDAINFIVKKYGADIAEKVSRTVPNLILENKKIR